MALGCGAKVLKYCLFGFNLIFVIAGITCASVGVWMIADKRAVGNLTEAFGDMKIRENITVTGVEDLSKTPTGVRDLGIVLASIGGFTLLIAFLGCCGAVKELRPLLVLYAIFLMIILASEISAAIYAAVKKDTIEGNFKDYTARTLKYYGGNDTTRNEMRWAWDYIMERHDCCGVHSEWLGERGFNVSKWDKEIHEFCGVVELYPPSCCISAQTQVQQCDGDYQYCPKEIANDPKKVGCYERIKQIINTNMAVIIGVAVAVGLVEIFGVIFSLCLCRAISHQE